MTEFENISHSDSNIKKVEKFLHDLDLPKEEFGTIAFWGHIPTWKEFKKKLAIQGMKTCSAQIYLQRSYLIGLDVIANQGMSIIGKLPTIISHINVTRNYSRGSEKGFDYKPKNIPIVNSKGGLVGVIKAYPDLDMLGKDMKDIRKPIREDPITEFELPKNPLLHISYFFEKLFLLDALES